jgi:hypothetical protein
MVLSTRPLALALILRLAFARSRILIRTLAGRPPRRSTGRVAAMTRRAAVPRLLTAGPALPLLEIGHHFLRSIGYALNRAIAAV